MANTQKQREELLRAARKTGMTGSAPAVHPRYRAIYRNLYGEEAVHTPSGTLGTRILLSLIFFAVFLSSDYNNQHIWKFSQTEIIKGIQAQPDYRSYVNQFLNL